MPRRGGRGNPTCRYHRGTAVKNLGQNDCENGYCSRPDNHGSVRDGVAVAHVADVKGTKVDM